MGSKRARTATGADKWQTDYSSSALALRLEHFLKPTWDYEFNYTMCYSLSAHPLSRSLLLV